MSDPQSVLFILPDCPGYFTELFYKLGMQVKEKGHTPVFISTSPFYEKFKKVNLSTVGKVYYLNDFLASDMNRLEYENIPVNNWSFYSSFIRQRYFFGRFLNKRDTLRKTKLFFQRIFDEHRTALVVSEGVSNSFIYLGYEQASHNKIPFFGFMASRIPYHFNIHIDIEGNEVLLNKSAPAEYTDSGAVPDYMKNSQFGGLFNKEYSFASFTFLREIIRFVFLNRYSSLETGNTKLSLLKVYQIAVRRMFFDLYFSRLLRVFSRMVTFLPEKVYVVYPLHFFPEASTSVQARYYDGNEFNLIKNIAFSLPENAVLVVKEHKSNVGNNSRRFYQDVKHLPNVILLDPYYKLKENLHRFDAVVTLTSTVGFEALANDVPVYVLGEVFYQNYPGSRKINSYSELNSALEKIQKRPILSGKNMTFNLYQNMCFPGSFNYMDSGCLIPENITCLMKPVFDFLETRSLPKHKNNVHEQG